MANSCSVAKEVKCRICNATGQANACTPTANVRAVEGESGQGNTLALEYQPEKQQQQQQQVQQKAQVNYVQTYPTLQAAYLDRNAGRYYTIPQPQHITANINTVYTKAEGKETESAVQIQTAKASETAISHEVFVNNKKEATDAYSQVQTRVIHNKPTPPFLL